MSVGTKFFWFYSNYYNPSLNNKEPHPIDVPIYDGFPVNKIDLKSKLNSGSTPSNPSFNINPISDSTITLPYMPTNFGQTILNVAVKKEADEKRPIKDGEKVRLDDFRFFSDTTGEYGLFYNYFTYNQVSSAFTFVVTGNLSGSRYLFMNTIPDFIPLYSEPTLKYGFNFFRLYEDKNFYDVVQVNGYNLYNFVTVSYNLSTRKLISYQVFPSLGLETNEQKYINDLFVEGLRANAFSTDNDSEPGGGGGSQDNTSNPVDNNKFSQNTTDPNYVKGALSTGFFGVYAPTEEQLRNLAKALWSTSFKDNIAKYLINPLDYMINYYKLPFKIDTQKSSVLSWGGIFFNQSVEMDSPTSQFASFDMGEISIEEYWKNTLDYDPYTKITLYLPFCGYQQLSTDEVIGSKLSINYNVDLLSGSGIAQVHVKKNSDGTNLDSVMYQFSCDLSLSLPIASSGNQKIENLKNGIMAATSFIGIAASGGAGFSATQQTVSGEVKAVGSKEAWGTVENLGATTMTAASTISQKTLVKRAGSIGSNNGYISVLYPYIIIERPIMSIPKFYPKFNGYPSNITSKLSELSGYTEVMDIHFDGLSATQPELDELDHFMKGGIIL